MWFTTRRDDPLARALRRWPARYHSFVKSKGTTKVGYVNPNRQRVSKVDAVVFTDWETLLRDYDLHHAPRHRDELRWFAEQETFERVIQLAARAESRRGKRLSHQRRIPREAIKAAEHAMSINPASFRTAQSFEDLLDAVTAVVLPIRGTGALYCYDAAVRLGAFLGLEPKYIYLHAGTLRGAKALMNLTGRRPWIAKEEIPAAPLRSRSAAEIEDILCIYERTFGTGVLLSTTCGRSRC